MRKQTYKFRAECISDVTKFIEKAKFWYCIKVDRYLIEKALKPDVVAEITTKESLDKILSVFRKISDSHVMMQTIQPKKLYTGIRNTGVI